MNTYTSSVIENNVNQLDSFATDLKRFFEGRKELSLFKKFPVRYEKEVTKKRLSKGQYLLSPCGIELNMNESNRIALELLELMKEHLSDRKDELTAIADAMIKGKILVNDVLLQVIRNEGDEIRKVIQLHNLSEDMFTFYAIYLARPFRKHIAKYLMEGIDRLNWFRGYCHVCGHWPVLAHLNSEIGQRTLWCLCCNSKWNFKRIQCTFCLNENHEHLEILNPENEESYRIQICKKCKRYLKEVRSNIEVKEFSFDKYYLGTLQLDIIAKKEGCIQESVLTVRYDNSNGNELLMYRQKEIPEND